MDKSAGTTATITALLRKEYLEVEVEVGVNIMINLNLFGLQMCQAFSMEKYLVKVWELTPLGGCCQMEKG